MQGVLRFGDNTGWQYAFRSFPRGGAEVTLNSGTIGLLMTIQDKRRT